MLTTSRPWPNGAKSLGKSCANRTGVRFQGYVPALEAQLLFRIRLKESTQRTPLNGLSCASWGGDDTGLPASEGGRFGGRGEAAEPHLPERRPTKTNLIASSLFHRALLRLVWLDLARDRAGDELECRGAGAQDRDGPPHPHNSERMPENIEKALSHFCVGRKEREHLVIHPGEAPSIKDLGLSRAGLHPSVPHREGADPRQHRSARGYILAQRRHPHFATC
jgi:hypothetical protein